MVIVIGANGDRHLQRWRWGAPLVPFDPSPLQSVQMDRHRYRQPSHCGVCAQNLQTRGLKNDDDVTLVLIFCAGHVGIYQINWL